MDDVEIGETGGSHILKEEVHHFSGIGAVLSLSPLANVATPKSKTQACLLKYVLTMSRNPGRFG